MRHARVHSPSTAPQASAPAHDSHASSHSAAAAEDVCALAHADARVAAIAATQRGRVTTEQLLAAGLGRGAIAHRVKSGRLHPRHVGVFAVGHAGDVPLGRETAALLACGEDAVLSHRSAAAVLGLVEPDGDAPVDVTLVGRQVRRPGIRGHRVRSLDARDVQVVAGLRLTSVARTLLDLAEDVTLGELERAVADALVRRLVTPAELTAVVRRSPGRRGARAVSAVLGHEGGPAFTRSEAERRFLALVRAGGLPPPEVNARLCGYEVDFLWRRERLVVEVDGYAFHATRAAFERDRRKDADLADAGFAVRRVTWRQLAGEAERLLVRLTRALDERRAS